MTMDTTSKSSGKRRLGCSSSIILIGRSSGSSSSRGGSMSIIFSAFIILLLSSIIAMVIFPCCTCTAAIISATTNTRKRNINGVIAPQRRQTEQRQTQHQQRRRRQQQSSLFSSHSKSSTDDEIITPRQSSASTFTSGTTTTTTTTSTTSSSSSTTTTIITANAAAAAATTTASMEGKSCSGNKLSNGQVQLPGFILCHPMSTTTTTTTTTTGGSSDPIYKFGIDTKGQLAYYINEKLFWYATPSSTTQSSACLFGGSCSPPSMQYIRLNAAGSLGGFDVDRNKLWDSHNDVGVYTDYALLQLGMDGGGNGEMENVVTDVIRNSTLILSEEGVVIQSADGVVTWKIIAPSPVDTATSGSAATGSSSTSSSSTTTGGGGEDISVSGTVFLDANGDGLRDSTSSSAVTFGNSLVDLSGMAVDLYDCADASNPEWLLLERTNSSGHYEFESADLMPLLEERGTKQLRVVITLSDAMLSEEYTFSPMSQDSDVNPNNGRTICWDLEEDGKQPLVWNAGVTKAVAEETVTTSRPTAKPVRPPTLRPTAKPASNSNAANENSTPADDSVPATSPSTSSSAGSATSSSVILSGVVFHDENNDGFYEFHEEATMPDITVELLDCDGKSISTGSTDDNGMYGFSDLAPGSYTVRFSPPGGYQLGDVWTGLVDDQGNLIAEGVNNHANPTTGSTVCKEYQGGSTEYSLNAGMIIEGASSMPSPKPSEDPMGDGTPCSGAKCPIDGMCRNKSGLCGAGVSFCNPESVWDPTCPDVSSLATVSDVADGPICNEDGSVGLTNSSASSSGEEAVQSTILSFTYSVKGADGVPPDANSIAKFEEELNARLACAYFDDPCLACNNNTTESISRNLRRRISSRARFLAVDDSSVSGISSLPKDEINPEKVCTDDPQLDCVVVDGKFTAYFPADMTPEAIKEESDQMLSSVKSEIEKNDWDNMTISYDSAPPTTVDRAETASNEDTGGGLSSGAIAGIVLFVLVLIVVVGVLLIRFIRNKREDEDKEPLKRQEEVPFGNGELESVQPRQVDQYESDSDDSSSSSSSSSGSSSSSSSSSSSGSSGSTTSSEEGEEEDDGRSASVVSGDTFPSTVAQATPSVLEVDYSSGEDDERSTNSTESEISDVKKTTSRGDEVDHENNHQLHKAASGDYNVEQGHDTDNFDREEVDNRDRRDGYPAQNYGIHDDNGDDDERSINSADPPGTSYRDLPQAYDWGGEMMAGASPPRTHTRAMHNNTGTFTDEYFDESSQRFDVFESESQSSGMSDFRPSNGRQIFAPRIGHGLDGLFLGNRTDQSQGSHGSQGSNGSHESGSRRSRRSNSSSIARPFALPQGEINQHNEQYGDGQHFTGNQDYNNNYNQVYGQESQGFRGSHPIRSDGSNNSRHSGHSQGESGPYVDDDHNVNNQDYMYDNQGYHMDGNYISDNYGNMDGYDHNQYNPPMYNTEVGNNRGHEYTADSLPPMDGNTTLPPMNTRTYDQQGFSNDGIGAENYHSYRQTANTVLSRPEQLDEISQTDTASTHQMSNASSRVPTVDNLGPNREQHEDSEESITSIFKSLSDIQTRLASKGKQPEQGAMPRRKTRKDSGNSYAPLSYQQPPPNSAGPGSWGNEGIVEDASMDGSQISNFSKNSSRNRQPQQGQ